MHEVRVQSAIRRERTKRGRATHSLSVGTESGGKAKPSVLCRVVYEDSSQSGMAGTAVLLALLTNRVKRKREREELCRKVARPVTERDAALMDL